MCLFCFSTEKPAADDMKGKYGAQYAPYLGEMTPLLSNEYIIPYAYLKIIRIHMILPCVKRHVLNPVGEKILMKYT